MPSPTARRLRHQPRLAFRAPREDVERLETLLAERRRLDPFANQSDLLREALAAFLGRPARGAPAAAPPPPRPAREALARG